MRSWKFILIVLILCAPLLPARASIVITGTRVIYPESSREVDVRLTNAAKFPVLVQAWIDDGDASVAPNEMKVPFILMPPVFRVESKKGQALRVIFTGEELPKDRESVYWLNVLEIPPKSPDADTANSLQIAFRTRIKLFYRPTALQESPSSVHEQLKWKIIRNDDGKQVLNIDNPSPYYISFNQIMLKWSGKEEKFKVKMIPPFSQMDFEAEKEKVNIKSPAVISYSLINDYGASVSGEKNIN